MTVGQNIKKIRLEKGLTQKQLAEKCGMFDSALRRIENGKQNPKIETVEKIANALNIPITDIIDNNTLNLFIDKEIDKQRQLLNTVGKIFSEDTKYALCLYDSLKPKNQTKTIGYMERLLEEEEKDYKELLKRATITIEPDNED